MKEQQDAVKAKNKARPKCEYCDKFGHKESECKILKSAIVELKKENTKKSVIFTTAAPAKAEEVEEESFEAMYVHSTMTVLHNQYCDKQRYYLDLAKSRGRIGSIASQQCLYQLSILCK